MPPGPQHQPGRVRARASVRITWLGHATALIELDGVRILTDPVLRDRIGPLARIEEGIRPEAIGTVDCVLISHLHADHADLPSLRLIDCSGPILAPSPARAWLASKGVRRVRELTPGAEVAMDGVHVRALLAAHDRRRHPLGPAADPLGYVISGSSSAYFAGDTDLFLAMARLQGRIDVALLPVAGWGPRVPRGHLTPETAAAAAALIAPAVAIPIHWGTFALGHRLFRLARNQRAAREFAALAGLYAPSVEIRVLAVGETTVWSRNGPGGRGAAPLTRSNPPGP